MEPILPTEPLIVAYFLNPNLEPNRHYEFLNVSRKINLYSDENLTKKIGIIIENYQRENYQRENDQSENSPYINKEYISYIENYQGSFKFSFSSSNLNESLIDIGNTYGASYYWTKYENMMTVFAKTNIPSLYQFQLWQGR